VGPGAELLNKKQSCVTQDRLDGCNCPFWPSNLWICGPVSNAMTDQWSSLGHRTEKERRFLSNGSGVGTSPVLWYVKLTLDLYSRSSSKSYQDTTSPEVL